MGFVHKTHDDSALDLLNGSPPKMLIPWDFMGLGPGVILMLALDSKAINLDVLGYGPPIAVMVIYIYITIHIYIYIYIWALVKS